jgi:hypothetical protein
MIHGVGWAAGSGRNTLVSTGSWWAIILIGRGLAGGEQDGQRADGQVGVRVDQQRQDWHRQRQPYGRPVSGSRCRRRDGGGWLSVADGFLGPWQPLPPTRMALAAARL